MKFVNPSASLALLGSLFLGAPSVSKALKCGIAGVTKQCLGKTDVRYDPDASYDLADQKEFWGDFSGLYVGDHAYALPDWSPLTERTIDGIPGSFDFSDTKKFVNFTVSGSRLHYKTVILAKSNTPGIPGIVIPYEVYYSSTFEKDGSASRSAVVEGFGQEGYESGAYNSTLTPIAGKALFGVDLGRYETLYCTSADCASIQVYGEVFTTADDGVDSLERKFGGLLARVDKATWETGFENAYAEFNIPTLEDATIKTPYLSQPEDTNIEFITGYKFSEEDWQKFDPDFGTSPYVEPDGILTGGFIAGVTIASIIVAVAIFSFIYKRGVEAREKRVKAAVAMSIAKTMNFSGSSKNLSPSELEAMFVKIDTDGNGNLSKDEIKGLVDDAGVANMIEKDYDILFASIDIDGNGTLDFAEFSAFFCSDFFGGCWRRI